MKTIQLFFICAVFFGKSFAQLPQQPINDFPNTIEGQFKKIYKKSNNYQTFKVMKKSGFLNLQKNVLDSINILKKDAVTKQQTINTQQKDITSLQNDITALNKNLTTSMNKEDSISFFGIQLTKATYNVILWGVILALLIGFIFFIYKFNASNSITSETKKNLAEVEKEFEQHRKKTLLKEQKLRRQLQDEINKQRGV